MVNANDTFPTYSKCRISGSYSHNAAGSIGRPWAGSEMRAD